MRRFTCRAMMVGVLTLTLLLSGGSLSHGNDLRSDVQQLVETLRSHNGSSRSADREFRTRTVIRPDGSISRSIFQAADRTPNEVQDKKVWAGMSYPREEEPNPVRPSYIFGSRPPFGGAPAKPREALPGGFFSASGHFPTANKLPQHIRFPSGAERPDRKLTRECRRTDYVLVTEYAWREALPDVEEGKRSALARAKRAREEFVEQIIELAERLLKRRLNKRCDTSELVRWLRKEVKQELCGFLEELNEENVDVLVARLTRWGLDPRKEFSPQGEERLLAALSSRVRDADGKPLGREHVKEWFGNPGRGEDGIPPDELLRLVKKAAEALPRAYVLRAFLGANAASLYDFQATLPGAVAETNGSAPPPPAPRGGMVGVGGSSRLNVIPEDWRSSTTLGEASVRWQFYREDVPHGFSMFVRSLSSDDDLQWKLFKKHPLADRDKAAAYVKLVRASEPLLAALRRCRTDESLQPLVDYRRRLRSSDREEKERVEQLLALLGHRTK